VSRFLEQIEILAVAPFILLIAAIAGTVQALPLFLHLGSLNLASARIAQVVLVTGTGLLYRIGAVLLWWFAVRRRQYPIWLSALHVTVGLAAADLLMNGLGYVAASIETHGQYALEFGRALPGSLSGPVGIALLRSPFWFVEALALIALGRLVLHMDSPISPPPVTGAYPDAVT
jgi:hypothetical protein